MGPRAHRHRAVMLRLTHDFELRADDGPEHAFLQHVIAADAHLFSLQRGYVLADVKHGDRLNAVVSIEIEPTQPVIEFHL